MSRGFKSSRGNPAFSRFNTDATSSVGATAGRVAGLGASSTGRGSASRMATQRSILNDEEATEKFEERLGEIYKKPITSASNDTEDLDYGLEMEEYKRLIQENTIVKGSSSQTDDTSEVSTPNKIFDDLAQKLAERTGDTEFIGSVERLAKKFNTTTNEVYAVINGESGFDHRAGEGKTFLGLTQMGPKAAKDAGVDYEGLKTASPSEQIAALDSYLSFWNYDGKEGLSLGLMQAAPGLAQSLKGSPSDTVVYSEGSKAWEANPGWRSDGDGPITIGSIDNYYT